MALSMVLLAACAEEKPAQHPIVGMAQFDLNCPREQLRYFQIDSGTWGVDGCGQRTKYVQICRQVGYGLFTHDECRWVRN
jgi:hypothetical protein